MNKQAEFKLRPSDVSISEDDIYAAMQEIPGYLDITPGDFKELYVHAYQHAICKITGSITAEQIMNREVVCFDRSTPLNQAARIMAENNFSGAPVIDYSDKVVGVISKKDFIFCIAGKGTRSFLSIILKFLECKECVAHTIEGKKVQDIMSSPAITITKTTSAIDIINLFKKHAINRVPVVDAGGCICGIITRSDLLKVPVSLAS